jgi:hypothetical protein
MSDYNGGAADNYFGFTVHQDIASAVVPKVGAALSWVGSSCIIAEVLSDRKSTRAGSRPISRLLLGMSVADFIFSVAWFLTTWASPKGTAHAHWAMGTIATCELQGFLLQFG